MKNTSETIKIGIVGLGLIGGSFAKALVKNEKYTVLAYDIDTVSLHYAQMTNAIDGELNEENLSECDFVLISLYPLAAVEYMQKNAAKFKKNAVVIDTVGTKREICETGFKLAEENSFIFVGGHPMAGTQFSGFKHSRETLFNNATMIITPKKNEDLRILDSVKKLMLDCGFAKMNVTDAETHDEIIAYTSQLAHVVSNAYVKSPTALRHKNFSAGSYKDLTRVARLNEVMWTELFFENRENLLRELDSVIGSLEKYRDALRDGNRDEMKELLKEGREIKERTLYYEKN